MTELFSNSLRIPLKMCETPSNGFCSLFEFRADFIFAFRSFFIEFSLSHNHNVVSPSVPSLNQTEEDVIALVKQSLKNLQTEYIDL